MANRKFTLLGKDQFKIPNSQELDQMKEKRQLQEQIDAQKKAISEIEAEIRALQSNLTLEELRAKQSKLQIEVYEMEAKLKKLRDGVILVKPEEKKLIEQTLSENMNHWRKRKRIFKDLWDAITENSPKDAKNSRRSSALNVMKMLELACNRIVN